MKLGNWKGILKISATSLPHNSNLLGVACQKLPYFSNQVALFSPCWLCNPKINWWEKNKTGSLEGDSMLQCNTNGKCKESQGTTTDSLTMHKLIIEHMQTGNSEPQYQEMTLESSSSLEYDAPCDHMFEQSELEQNMKDFGSIPRSSLQLYKGPPVNRDNAPDILQEHKLVKDSKLPNYLGCHIPVDSGLNIKKMEALFSQLLGSTIV